MLINESVFIRKVFIWPNEIRHFGWHKNSCETVCVEIDFLMDCPYITTLEDVYTDLQMSLMLKKCT